MSLAQQNKIKKNIYIIYFRKKKKKTQVDTLIFPNEDFIYGMKWRKKKHSYFENIFISTKTSWENKYFNQRIIP